MNVFKLSVLLEFMRVFLSWIVGDSCFLIGGGFFLVFGGICGCDIIWGLGVVFCVV